MLGFQALSAQISLSEPKNLGLTLKFQQIAAFAGNPQGWNWDLAEPWFYCWKVTDLKPYKNQVSSILKRFLRVIAILLALVLISITFTFFKPIDVESIGYQYYNDKTYRVEKTNQITDLLKGELTQGFWARSRKSGHSKPEIPTFCPQTLILYLSLSRLHARPCVH